ncbi:alanine racemase [Labilibaculum antarcticum]|uniref:Diaminopimelate decarboxylase n=1 Tax=Labilibaculum antarcticum TaxID=1717717 RepID=A0A1Y1CPP3_9BACT|nr:alanine racemase [Labilibaculum antarcticum]BAX81922.1 diaminopimelate decarboxylase [Labilibaculum antarcticum]
MKKLDYERPILNKVNAGMPDKFGMKTKTATLSHIEEHSVTDILKEYGSPVYVISEPCIRKTYRTAYKAFSTRYPRVQFAWSYKTNYMNAVCKIFHSEGAWAEVVSGFEYSKAIENGISGDQIIFNGPEKSKEDLERAITDGAMIHLDGLDEFYFLGELAEKLNKKANVAIRINLNAGIYPQWDRFGFNLENGEAWHAINRIMLHDNMELVGLHTHMGTYITAVSAYAIAASKLADMAVRLQRKFNHSIKYLDLGGGFATRNTLKGAYLPGSDTCPSFDDYAEALTSALLGSELPPDKLPLLILETGRALIDESGYALGSVLANKRLVDGRRATVIDIGVNMLFTAFWYEHEVMPTKLNSEQTENTTIYGPLCMNIDIIREAIQFPLLQKGDAIVIPRIGAYNMTQWMQFIKLRPPVLLIDEDRKIHLIRKKESFQEFNAQENVPEHLK